MEAEEVAARSSPRQTNDEPDWLQAGADESSAPTVNSSGSLWDRNPDTTSKLMSTAVAMNIDWGSRSVNMGSTMRTVPVMMLVNHTTGRRHGQRAGYHHGPVSSETRSAIAISWNPTMVFFDFHNCLSASVPALSSQRISHHIF